MTRLRGISAAAAVFLLLFGAACAGSAGDAESTGAPSPDGSTGSDPAAAGEAPVLRVAHVGGFITPEVTLSRIPLVSLYDDGRLITPGPQIMIYPAPALPSVQVTTVKPEVVQDLVRQATAAGVRNGTDFGRPNVADAPNTRVTVVTAEGTQSVEVVALGEAMPDDPALTAAQRTARQKLSAFVEQLGALQGTAGAPYEPAALAAIAVPWKNTDEPGISAPPAREWPGPQLPGDVGAAGLGCATVTGADVGEVLAAAKDANALTPWTSGGKQWTVTLRPLLPDEASCAALGSQG
ncbi:hypothetical protein [Spirilliplanes yamanashiensis]|uniref:Lipoprotein n=1 Tax=Spirilliplanes yamanashiensis TaxID=42233 RepID=A0A8J3YBE8_9ACTN|nr:hypothetical protein [Spirilliplanes yamanashiensis]MDP9817983.1 hypothetical protein [Spirilliplanes yamanashiensis]GIJ04792.1 hypothetical protein Sya03_41440 [Spirilliplanes yamanashiensis]